MATLTVKNSTYSSTSTSITITFTTDVTPTAVKLTKDGTNWITATSYTSNSATFNISSWGKGTFTNCQLKVSYVEESSGGDTPGSSLTISNITGGTFTVSNNATITYTTSAAVTKHEFVMNYTGSDSGFTDGTARVTSSGNNHTMTFNAGELSAGTKNGAIRVTDANGNTAKSNFTLIINEATQTPDPTPDPTPNPPSSGSALNDWDVYNNTYSYNYVAYMASQVGVKNKAIRITADKKTVTAHPTGGTGQTTTKDYASGGLVTKKAFKYGTFTFKCKLSANNTYLWAMIWTLPDSVDMARPEFDLWESWGSKTNNAIVQTYHAFDSEGNDKMNYQQANTPVDLTQEHEVKAVWTQDNVFKMYCDGVLKLTIKDYMVNWKTGEVDYQLWFLNLGLGTFANDAPNGTGWMEITDYKFEPVYTRDRVKQHTWCGNWTDGTLPSGPLPGSGGGGSATPTPTPTPTTLSISNITGGTFTTSQQATITYTTSAAVTKHEFNMNYSGSDSGFTDGTARITSNGNNHTMTFNPGDLSAGTKNGAIRVTDASGNTAVAQYTLVITGGGSTPTPTPNPNPSTLSITNINGGTFTTSNSPTVTYTTSAAVVKHEYRMNKEYSYTNAEGKVTSSGNNHTIRFNAGELSTGTKNGSIRVTDANGNTAEADFTLIINEGTSTTNYSITKNLTNCTCSNSASSISKGSSYSATITANNECALSTLTVTMGGTDITSSAVSGKTITGGTISISNVSGNIVITASAEAIPGGGAPESTTLTIMNIKVLSATEASTQINYTTNRAVTTHYFNMWYSGADSGFTDGTSKVTDNGNNNYTMTFANELSAGAKSPAIKVQDSKGNTAIKTFDLTVTS